MPNNTSELTLGEKAVEAGLRLYNKFADRKTMPTNRRIFLESVLDKSKDPITEKAFSPEELETLSNIIFNKYAPLVPALKQYEDFLKTKLREHDLSVAAKNKDRILYPEWESLYRNDLDAIQKFSQGQLTPTFIDITSGSPNYKRDEQLSKLGIRDVFDVKPVISYEDYGVPYTAARQAMAGADPRAALHTTLGRFKYEADPATGGLLVVDKYDFNPLVSPFTGATKPMPRIGAEQLVTNPLEGMGGGLYGLLRQYAGRVLPEGQGRDVKVRINRLAPASVNRMID